LDAGIAGLLVASGFPASPEQRGRAEGDGNGCDHAARSPAACLEAGRTRREVIPVDCPVRQCAEGSALSGRSIRHIVIPGTSQ
jgi:hypothetical protein